MYKLDATTAAEMIADEAALATLRGYPIEQVLASVENLDDITNDEEAFNGLMAAMYALRPVGYL